MPSDRAEPPDTALLRGWRRDLAGEAILGWLRGDAALVADPDSEAGIALVPR